MKPLEINMDVDDLFKQTVFKLVNKKINFNFTSNEEFSTTSELFENFSKKVAASFSDELQRDFYNALVDEFHKRN